MAKTVWADTLVKTDGSGPVDASKGIKNSLGVKDINNAAYTITDVDGFDTFTSIATLTADRIITLPAAASNIGRTLIFKKTEAGAFRIIIDTPGAELIDGAAQNRLVAQNSIVVLRCMSSTLWTVLQARDYIRAFALGTISVSATDQAGTSILVPEGEWILNAQGNLAAKSGTTTTPSTNNSFSVNNSVVIAGSDTADYATNFSGPATLATNQTYAVFKVTRRVIVTAAGGETWSAVMNATFGGTAPFFNTAIIATRVG